MERKREKLVAKQDRSKNLLPRLNSHQINIKPGREVELEISGSRSVVNCAPLFRFHKKRVRQCETFRPILQIP